MGTLGTAFSVLAAVLHLLFFYLESVAFKNSAKVQKIFLGRKQQNKEIVDTVQLFLFNQGCYNLLLALGTLGGVFYGIPEVVKFTLFCYVGAGLALLVSSPSKFQGALAQIVPALLGYLL